MKVKFNKDSLMIVAETEFEEQVMTNMFPHGSNITTFLKTGSTASEVIGLKIITKDK